MEKTLTLLKRKNLLRDWSDAQILPGQNIGSSIEERLGNFDIYAFLLSPDFLESDACMDEWNAVKSHCTGDRIVFRIPIILRECPWKDFLGDDDVKALPNDGSPIRSFSDTDVAWQQVYEGIAKIIDTLKTTFTPKASFLNPFRTADLPSSKPLLLNDIFVFPRLVAPLYTGSSGVYRESTLSSVEDLLSFGSTIIHGQAKSGKTALAKHLFLTLVENHQSVLFADAGNVMGHFDEDHLGKLYEEQFNGDYILWRKKENRILIVDNMSDAPKLINFIKKCSADFSKLYVFTSSDIFHSFLRDEVRLANFNAASLEQLKYSQQEELIRKRLATLDATNSLTDGFVDQAEDRVNSVILSERIVPRYPFFVLSILQTYDAFVSSSLSITSYGHCYQVFILSSLRRAGIDQTDEAVTSVFNFAEHLALAIYKARNEGSTEPINFELFIRNYTSDFFVAESMISRLTHKDFGIITPAGEFKTAYMYYFFLGKLFATNQELAQKYLPKICEYSYDEGNYLTLIFAIHHATDENIIDDILLRTMIELEDLDVATLCKAETMKFQDIVSSMPESVLSTNSVEEERAEIRQTRDQLQEMEHVDSGFAKDRDSELIGTSMVRVFKNNRILGQVLRNRYGKLPKQRVEEIIETIADSSFRLVNMMLKDKDEIRRMAKLLDTKWPEIEHEELLKILTFVSFVWTVMNIEQAVHAVSVPEIKEAIEAVVERNDTPAYDIFGYFVDLDSSNELTSDVKHKLKSLCDGHDDLFVKRVLSLRTQAYMNSHRSKVNIEQAICSVLGIKYSPRMRALPSVATKSK